MINRFHKLFAILGPGILVAATGVGAGDLMTASLGGSAVGLVIVWAAVLGAVLKLFLNEGIARWQMATGQTLLEGWVERLGGWIQWVFLVYLLGWTLFTGGALITACGVAGNGLLPISSDPDVSKIFWGVTHSLVGLVLVWFGGFRVFERVMGVCIAVMFVTVVTTALSTGVAWGEVGRGLVVPSIPRGGLGWVLGVLGGVGGTLTLLSYGYWIREEGRNGSAGLKASRIDLSVGYGMTAVFGVAMIIIGSGVDIQGRGADVAPLLAQQLGAILGPLGSGIFLIGFWGAVFSSLLGVWQSVPYLFADFVSLFRDDSDSSRVGVDWTRTRAYRIYLVAIAVAPIPLLWLSVQRVQLAYAVLGSLFMPLLAFTLLLMNNRRSWVGEAFRNRWLSNTVLTLTLVLFGYLGLSGALENLSKMVAPR